MPNTEEDLRELLREAEAAKFRIFAQGDLALLSYIDRLDGKASASQLVLALTLARGKMVSLTQIAPILKTLQRWGCVISSKSNGNARILTIYKLTPKGKAVLRLGHQLIHTLSSKPRPKHK